MCRFSKLLLFSFFSCNDGNVRLMKRASYSCCNFLCIVLAAIYLKYHRYRLWCLPMGAIHKMAATLGDFPTARALRGNFSSQRSSPHLAKHFSLGFLFLLRAKKPHTNENLSGSTPPSRYNADFCFHRPKILDKGLRELLKDLRLSATCDCRAESDAGISEKPNWFRCTGWHCDRKRSQSVFNLQEDFLFVKFDIVERWRAEHQLQLPSSYRCQLHMYRMQVSQSWQTRGGRHEDGDKSQ